MEYNNLTFDELVAKGQLAYENKDYEQALILLDQAYSLDQPSELNWLITKVLVADNQYQTAQVFADEFIESYLENKELAQLYVTIANANHHYLAAREFILWLPHDWQQTLLLSVEHSEIDYRQTMAQTVKTISRHFYHLSDVDSINQHERLIATEKLPLTDYLIGAKFVLIDPFLSQLVKATILDRLRRLQVNDEFKMLWIDQTELMIIPSQLTALDETIVYRQMTTFLAEAEKEFGSVTIQALQEELRLMLMFIYPKLSEVIYEPESWVKGMLAEAYGNKFAEEDPVQKKWRLKLQKEVMLLMP